MKKYDLEERLIAFSVLVIEMTQKMNSSYAGNHLAKQLLRSGTSAALNYGEAQSAESRRDFLHKMKIVLKELRESLVCLKIIKQSKIHDDLASIENVSKECNELVSIFVKSIETAQRNSNKTNI